MLAGSKMTARAAGPCIHLYFFAHDGTFWRDARFLSLIHRNGLKYGFITTSLQYSKSIIMLALCFSDDIFFFHSIVDRSSPDHLRCAS